MARYLDQIESLTKQLKSLEPLSSENQQKIEKKFRLEFNYNSNHMEGNTLTYGETELLLIFEDTKGNHTMREYDEMRAHDVAYRLIKEWAIDKERPLTEQNIKSLNEIILVRSYWKDAITPDGQNTRRKIKIGDYKDHPNSVRLQNGEIFDYATPTDTPILMGELIEWFRSQEKSMHPVELAAMLHYKFVLIHPFDDGNGRVARLLMNYVLLRASYPAVIIKSEDKSNYLRVLRNADVGDYEPLISYVAEQLIWALSISIKAAKGESIDEPGDLDKKIRALKQRLNTDESLRVKVTKNREAIKMAYEAGILPLIYGLGEKLSEFDTLFKSTTENLLISTSKHVHKSNKDIRHVNELISKIPEEIIQFGYSYSFTHLRRSGLKNISLEIGLSFVFHQNIYEVILAGIGFPVEKLYDESFSSDEMKLIIEKVGNYVVEQIETKIDS